MQYLQDSLQYIILFKPQNSISWIKNIYIFFTIFPARRRLTTCPILEGEDYLRLLNFQHNLISRVSHLENLKRLIFLDFYDNQIEEISGLSALRSLRVLMLGKNRLVNIGTCIVVMILQRETTWKLHPLVAT